MSPPVLLIVQKTLRLQVLPPFPDPSPSPHTHPYYSWSGNLPHILGKKGEKFTLEAVELGMELMSHGMSAQTARYVLILPCHGLALCMPNHYLLLEGTPFELFLCDCILNSQRIKTTECLRSTFSNAGAGSSSPCATSLHCRLWIAQILFIFYLTQRQSATLEFFILTQKLK